MAKRRDREPRESRLADGWTLDDASVPGTETGESLSAMSDSSGDAAVSELEQADERPQLSSGALVILGSIGGIYLLYTMVWFSWANYYSTANSAVADGSGLIGAVMQQVVFWLAPLAPALWFCCVLVLNRGATLGRLVLWLIVGLVVLVPLPMFDFGAVS